MTHQNGAQKFTYDANGNMTVRIAKDSNDNTRTWTQEWSVENMLKRATAGGDDVQFFYDADGQMVLRVENGNKKTINLADGLYQRTYVDSNHARAEIVGQCGKGG